MKSVLDKILLLCLALGAQTWAQLDSLSFRNGNILIGEIKSLSKGVITVETDYSDSDFKIEWDKVVRIVSHGSYIVNLENGDRLISTIRSSKQNDSLVTLFKYGREIVVKKKQIFYIKAIEEKIKNRLNASIDIGSTYTKANNLRQLSVRSNLSYLTEKWSGDGYFDAVRSTQDSVASTSRTDANLGINYFLVKKWSVFVSANFLQNDEQLLKLRANPKAALRHFMIQTNKVYWAISIGGAWNTEKYTDASIPDRKTVEAVFGTELNLYNVDKLSLLTNISVYKSLDDTERSRADFKIDLKYDLPLDFYIKVGYTHNFDSNPVEGASQHDFVLQTTFGWEL